MAKIIGLTGGIGSGKTTVARYFEQLGVPVYIADDEARKLMELPETIESVSQAFGSAIIANGQIDRKKLADTVFNNPEKLQQLNQIIHPLVAQHFSQWLSEQSDCPYVIKEAAILFESGSYRDCDAVISVTAPLQTRIERVISRDDTTAEAVRKRIENQWSDEQRIRKSDYIITNTNLEDTRLQVEKIHKALKYP